MAEKKVVEYMDGYNSENSIAIIWCIDDIKITMDERDDRIGITDEECMSLLLKAVRGHDASNGVSWDSIEYYLDEFIQEKSEVV
tara:strand:+ start:301 stop:552 length:252 start_codon:yes stop_codon:yes gene_type:complete